KRGVRAAATWREAVGEGAKRRRGAVLVMGPGESGNGKGETRNVMRRDAVRRFPFPASRFPALHGEGGIRTPDRGISPYNGLANRRLQPLGHLSNVAALEVSATQESGVPPCCSRAIQRMSRSGQRNPGSTSSPLSSPSGATVETVPSAR